MILTNLSATWKALAPALGNHLWQSTLFAVIAGLLTLILRKNHARARYWLWLAASVKFLIPFSVLVGLGSHLAWSRGAAAAKAGLYVAMDEISQPFTPSTMPVITQDTSGAAFQDLLPALLAAAWLCGFVVVLIVWCVRWLRISAALQEAAPLREGREVDALRRLERLGGLRRQIEMRLSRASLEPGIFGLARPVLVWPKGISEHLDDAHMEAILAHEVWHVRRRDNLAAAVHMVVEAIFWFHPLVWWLGARLVEERELACDEEVLALGSDRQVYAESILKVCEFCVGSSLSCVAGVTGADLKKRMVHIMTKNVVRKLDFSRKLLLSAAGLAAVAMPIVFGLVRPAQSRAESQAEKTTTAAPMYQVALSKPEKSGIYKTRMMMSLDGFTATGVTLQEVILQAYGVDDQQIAGAPYWLNSERFDIDAKIDRPQADELRKLTGDQRGLGNSRLQAFLADYFKLKLHRETRDLPVYALVIAENGPKLHEAKPGDTYPNGFKGLDGRGGAGMMNLGPAKLTGQGVPVSTLAGSLSRRLGLTVLDKTGLTGNYDFTLHWTATETAPPESSRPAILTAVQEQLGLKLEPQTVPLETLVIDHVENPSEPQAQNNTAIAPVYEVASIRQNTTGEPMPPFHIVGKPFVGYMFKPDRFMATNATLFQLLQRAYSVEADQVAGGPDWIKSIPYDVDVRPDKSFLEATEKLGPDERLPEWKRMLQTLLTDRFKLALHHENRELPVYALVIAPTGSKLKEAKPGDTYPDGVKRRDGQPQGPGLWVPGPGQLVGQGVSLGLLEGTLSGRMGGRVVLDKTGLTGNYDFMLHWTPPEGGQPGTDSSAALLTAIQEQLGLKLELQKAPVEVLVIDHAEKPAEK